MERSPEETNGVVRNDSDHCLEGTSPKHDVEGKGQLPMLHLDEGLGQKEEEPLRQQDDSPAAPLEETEEPRELLESEEEKTAEIHETPPPKKKKRKPKVGLEPETDGEEADDEKTTTAPPLPPKKKRRTTAPRKTMGVPVVKEEKQDDEDPDLEVGPIPRKLISLNGAQLTWALINGIKTVENRNWRLQAGWYLVQCSQGKASKGLEGAQLAACQALHIEPEKVLQERFCGNVVGAIMIGSTQTYTDYVKEHPEDPWPMKRGKRQSLCNVVVNAVDFSQLGPLPVLGTLTTAEVSESVRSEVRRRMKMMGKRFEEDHWSRTPTPQRQRSVIAPDVFSAFDETSSTEDKNETKIMAGRPGETAAAHFEKGEGLSGLSSEIADEREQCPRMLEETKAEPLRGVADQALAKDGDVCVSARRLDFRSPGSVILGGSDSEEDDKGRKERFIGQLPRPYWAYESRSLDESRSGHTNAVIRQFRPIRRIRSKPGCRDTLGDVNPRPYQSATHTDHTS